MGNVEEPKEGNDGVTGEESTQDYNFGRPSQWVKASVNSIMGRAFGGAQRKL